MDTKAVSYTHLDVYKRQAFFLINLNDSPNHSSFLPVSHGVLPRCFDLSISPSISIVCCRNNTTALFSIFLFPFMDGLASLCYTGQTQKGGNVMNKLIILLGVVGVSMSSLLVRWSQAPSLTLVVYRMGFASVLLIPWVCLLYTSRCV